MAVVIVDLVRGKASELGQEMKEMVVQLVGVLTVSHS